MQRQPQPQGGFGVLLSQLDSVIDRNNIKLNQELFITGYLFGKFRLQKMSDFQTLFDVLKGLSVLVLQKVITQNQKLQVFQRVVAKEKINISKVFQSEVGGYINDCLNKGPVSPSKIEDLESQKYIKSLLIKEKEQRLAQEKVNQQIARQLQAEEEMQMKKKLSEIKKSSLNMSCPICLQQIELLDLALLSCEHIFHKKCISNTLKFCIDDRKFPIKCPGVGCSKEIIPSDVHEFAPQDYIKKYETYSLHKFIDTHNDELSWCPTPGCQYAFDFRNGQNEFQCPLCFKVYCLKCKVEYHKGMTCKEFNIQRKMDVNDRKFMDFVRGAKYKQCPKCHFWVEKTMGCDHMTCRCRFQFCYVCGGEYGKCQCRGSLPPLPPPIIIGRPMPFPYNIPTGPPVYRD